MHENELSRLIIGAAIEVHREAGPGLIEKPYEEAMCHELNLRGWKFTRQRAVPFVYKGITLSTDLRTDLIVADKVIVDLKAKDQISAIDKMKMLTYLRFHNLRLGLIINFHVELLKDGVHRVVNNLLPPPPPETPANFHA